MDAWVLVTVGLVLIVIAIYYLNRGPRGIREQVTSIQSNYDVSKGRVVSWFRRKQSESRTKLAKQAAEEATATTTLSTATESSETAVVTAQHTLTNTTPRLDEVREREAIQHRQVLAITQEATAMRLDNLTYLEVRKKIELDTVDINRQWEELQQKLRAGFIYQQKDYQYLQMHREYLFALYDQRKQIGKAKDPAKKEKLALLEEHIGFMESNFRERQRLLQAGNGEDASGSDQDTES